MRRLQRLHTLPQLCLLLAALQWNHAWLSYECRTCGRLAKLRSTSYVGPSGQRKAAEKLSYSLLDTIHAQRSLLAELQVRTVCHRGAIACYTVPVQP